MSTTGCQQYSKNSQKDQGSFHVSQIPNRHSTSIGEVISNFSKREVGMPGLWLYASFSNIIERVCPLLRGKDKLNFRNFQIFSDKF